MIAWQPIETAPKDGSLVLLYDPEYPWNNGMVVGSWSENIIIEVHRYGPAWEMHDMQCGDSWGSETVTHWQPIKPPSRP